MLPGRSSSTAPSSTARIVGILGIVAASALIGGCQPTSRELPADAAEDAPGYRIDLASARVVDLTHPFDEDTIYWPTSPSSFELERLSYGRTEAGYFYAANALSTPEHGGTHLDAPIHFAEGRWTAEEIPVERLMGPGVVIDVTAQAAEDPDSNASPPPARGSSPCR